MHSNPIRGNEALLTPFRVLFSLTFLKKAAPRAALLKAAACFMVHTAPRRAAAPDSGQRAAYSALREAHGDGPHRRACPHSKRGIGSYTHERAIRIRHP